MTHHLSERVQHLLRKLSLRSLLVVPFVAQIVIALALTGFLALRSGEAAVEEAVTQLRQEITSHVTTQLNSYLSTPQLINRLNLSAIDQGILDITDVQGLEYYFWQQAQDFAVVDFIYYGSAQGEFAAGGWPLGRDRPMQRHRVTRDRPLVLQFFNTDGQGNPVEEVPGIDDFDVTQRPWYQAAVAAGQPTWGPVFTFQAFPAVAIPAATPVFDDDGTLLGVLVNNFFLPRITDFLKTIQVGKTGQIFIIERQGEQGGNLIASSSLDQPFRLNENNQAERIDITAAGDLDPLLPQVAQAILAEFTSFDQITAAQPLEARMAGAEYFLQLEPYQDSYGLDWLVVVVMPRADFLGPLISHRRTTLVLFLVALGMSLGVGLYTSRWIATPIQRLGQATTAIAAGDFQQHLPATGLRELDALSRSFGAMADQLHGLFQQLHRQAHEDALTGLPNRMALMEILEGCIATAQQQRRYCFAVLFLDLDNFKLINDSLGHLVGDQVLIAVSRRLLTVLPPTATMARFGGDEFVIVLEGISTVVDATHLSNTLFQALQMPLVAGDREIFTTASIGIVLSTLHHETAVEFLRDADIALYRAKADGKARYEVFTQHMYEVMAGKLQIEMALRRSIQTQALDLAYQPIINLQTGHTVGFEALCRWRHPTLGEISPGEFIPLAEDMGLIVALERWVLHQACAQMRQWQNQFPGVGLEFISVNLSPNHVMHPQFLDHVEQVVRTTGLNRTYLKLEVTESLMLQNPDLVRVRLHRLQQAGVRISLDDFGTGYSSLSYLHQFSFDTLKIDRSFVERLELGSPSLIQAIIAMAHSLGIGVIAEGIETQAQLEYLMALACEYGQGHFFSAAISAQQVTTRLRSAQVR